MSPAVDYRRNTSRESPGVVAAGAATDKSAGHSPYRQRITCKTRSSEMAGDPYDHDLVSPLGRTGCGRFRSRVASVIRNEWAASVIGPCVELAAD